MEQIPRAGKAPYRGKMDKDRDRMVALVAATRLFGIFAPANRNM